MAKKMDVGKVVMKSVVRAIPTAVIASVILALLGLVVGVIQSIAPAGIIATLFMGITAFILFVHSKAMHKGEEDIVTMIPTLILVGMVASILASFIPLFAIAFEINTITALAMTLTTIYYAEEISRGIF